MIETFTEISPQQAWELIENEGATLVDIRDARRYIYSHRKMPFI